MVSVYNDADYLSAYKQKQRTWWVFVVITLVYLAVCVAMTIYNASLPYADPKAWIPQWTIYILTVIYMIFTFPYMAIKYSRVRKYVNMLSNVSTGLKLEECNYFYCFDDQPLPKENVDALSCIFQSWNKKKQEWREREVYFDPEKPLPPFECGDFVRYVLQGKFIVQYEILEKRALEFEEVEEDFEDAPTEEGAEVEEQVEVEE